MSFNYKGVLMALENRLKKNDLVVGITGINSRNPFDAENSPVRGMLLTAQNKTAVTIQKPEIPTILSGIETEMLKGNTGAKIPANTKVLAICEYRHKGKTMETTVIYYNSEKNMIDREVIATYKKNDKWFGYKEEPTEEFDDMRVGTVFKEETKLSTTPSDVGDIEAIGVNANIAWVPDPATDEDSMVISDELARSLEFSLYHTFTLNYTSENIPINANGDKDHYKPIPDIGDTIRRDGILFGLRNFNPDDYLGSFSSSDLLIPDEAFDELTRVKQTTDLPEEERRRICRVVDIRPYFIGDKKLGSLGKGFHGTYEQLDGYNRSYTKYLESICDAVKELEVDYPDATFSNQLSVDFVNGGLVTNNRIKKSWNREKIGIWRVDITVEYVMEPNVKSKLTTSHGHKGIVSARKPREEMYVDGNGLYADAVINPLGIISRMNMGNPFEGFLAANTKVVCNTLKDMYASDEGMDVIDNYITGYLDLINDYMSDLYLKQSVEERIEFILDVKIIKTLEDDRSRDISIRIMNSKYCMNLEDFFILENGEMKKIKSDIYMQSNYLVLLYKLGETWLGCNLSHINKLGIPVAASKEIKARAAYNPTPGKYLSIAEARMHPGFVSREYIAEMRDRSTSPASQSEIAYNILTAEKPMAIDRVIDREKLPLGGDVPLIMLHSLTETFGEQLINKKEQK